MRNLLKVFLLKILLSLKWLWLISIFYFFVTIFYYILSISWKFYKQTSIKNNNNNITTYFKYLWKSLKYRYYCWIINLYNNFQQNFLLIFKKIFLITLFTKLLVLFSYFWINIYGNLYLQNNKKTFIIITLITNINLFLNSLFINQLMFIFLFLLLKLYIDDIFIYTNKCVKIYKQNNNFNYKITNYVWWLLQFITLIYILWFLEEYFFNLINLYRLFKLEFITWNTNQSVFLNNQDLHWNTIDLNLFLFKNTVYILTMIIVFLFFKKTFFYIINNYKSNIFYLYKKKMFISLFLIFQLLIENIFFMFYFIFFI